jgi:hypothetical protein
VESVIVFPVVAMMADYMKMGEFTGKNGPVFWNFFMLTTGCPEKTTPRARLHDRLHAVVL